jgi:GAF domain-containing protein
MEERERSYYRALYTVARAVSSSLDLQQVLDSIVTSATWAVGAKACMVRLVDRAREELLATASYGLSQEYISKGAVEISKSPLDQLCLEGRVVQVPDMSMDPRVQYPEEAKREGLKSMIILPLMHEGKSFGIMRFYSRTEREFTPDEIDFLGAVVDLSALAIENARIHEALRTDYEALTFWLTHHGT